MGRWDRYGRRVEGYGGLCETRYDGGVNGVDEEMADVWR
jgi:hypothetical protein